MNVFKGKVLPAIKKVYCSPLFWIRLGVLGVWLIAAQLYLMSQQRIGTGIMPVYVKGGNIDADVRGYVTVDDVDATVSVEVNNISSVPVEVENITSIPVRVDYYPIPVTVENWHMFK